MIKDDKLEKLHSEVLEKEKMIGKSRHAIEKGLESDLQTLADFENAEEFFQSIAYMTAQAKATRAEEYFIHKLGQIKVSASDDCGDGFDESTGFYYEYKISTTNKNQKINAVQIRLWQKIDFYILAYIDEDEFRNSKIYLIPHEDMIDLVETFGSAAHGTTTANVSNQHVEFALRPSMKKVGRLEEVLGNYRSLELMNKVFGW